LSAQKPGNCFTYAYNGIARSLLTPARVESARIKQSNVQIKALWDTGASLSLISREIASQLNLRYVSKIKLSTPSDKSFLSNVYLVNLYLPNNTVFPDLKVAEGVLNSCDMLIGMDVRIKGIEGSRYSGKNHENRVFLCWEDGSGRQIETNSANYSVKKPEKCGKKVYILSRYDV
jgi:predicted aspartyl protease